MNEHPLVERATGSLAAAAIGDALGGSTEGWESHEIHDHYGGWVDGVVQSIRHARNELKPFSPFWKGDGHVTDDTLMTRALVQAYAVKRDHLNAYDVERLLVPLIVDEPTWIPELDREDLLYHRLFLAEKWLVLKLRFGPRRRRSLSSRRACGLRKTARAPRSRRLRPSRPSSTAGATGASPSCEPRSRRTTRSASITPSPS